MMPSSGYDVNQDKNEPGKLYAVLWMKNESYFIVFLMIFLCVC